MSLSNCIFANDKLKCKSSAPPTLVNVICLDHLRNVYGLDVMYHKFHDESFTGTVGPFLMLAQDVSFEENTVVLPTREFTDKYFRPDLQMDQQDDLMYKMNPNIINYVTELINSSGQRDMNSEKRYQYELIRNLSVAKKEDISIQVQNNSTEPLMVNFKNFVQTRVCGLNIFMETTNIWNHAKNITLINLDNSEVPPISPFYKMLVTNMYVDMHVFPQNEILMPVLGANLMYKNGIGFVTMEKITSPMPLVVLGIETGSAHFYRSKAITLSKSVKNGKRVPDASLIYDITRGST